jgi:hypothetical protein
MNAFNLKKGELKMAGLIFLGLCLASGLIAGYIFVITQIEMRRAG